MTHTQAFRAQSDFPAEAKIKVGENIWTPETAGSRLYTEVLSKNPSTVGKAIDLAAKLDAPFTVKQVQGHLKWIYTAGEMEVDGKSYPVEAKVAKPEPKVEKPKVEKAKAVKAKVMAARKRSAVKTKKAA